MRLTILAVCLLTFMSSAQGQTVTAPGVPDSDGDGLNDATEDALLQQFAPQFMVSHGDCSVLPAQFVPFQPKPVVQADDGTIYGQVFPRTDHEDQVEAHYYHLWRQDCGEMGHSLDAEHVSVFLEREGTDQWKALYWYAAAHENTVCDASQITRATTLHAESHGPTVWVSFGKHAAFFSDKICSHGCGGDRCQQAEPLVISHLINLGEPSAPMNGATWVDSQEWQLPEKLHQTDFTAARTARIESLPGTDIAWANPGSRHMQAAILGGNNAMAGASTGLRATNTALVLADSDTDNALNGASNSAGSALAKAYRSVRKALQTTANKMQQ